MSKISPEHLARGAFVYVRQSTADQLRNNHESRRRQYALAERAQMLGWSEVVVIDDDLGVSAGGVARPGFERLLAAICAGQVGAVVSIEASRLARNGRDWHTLLEFCALVGSVIVDEDGVYDPRSVNDRLLLGMKGTMSEMELSLLRQRSAEALKLKAARGDLHTTVAIGFVRSEDDRIELDPDQRIREAIGAVFARFAQAAACVRYCCGSVRSASSCRRRSTKPDAAASSGGCRATTRFCTSWPIRSMRVRTLSAAPRAGCASRPVASAWGVVTGASARIGRS
jgi:DNA invertase Pin-like site-specific DNA recombinase